VEFKEEIMNLRNEKVFRIKSGVIIVAGLLSLFLGIMLIVISLKYDVQYLITIGSIFIFFVFPVSLIYLVVRFFMGGRDTVLGFLIAIVFEEYLKGKIKNRNEDKK